VRHCFSPFSFLLSPFSFLLLSFPARPPGGSFPRNRVTTPEQGVGAGNRDRRTEGRRPVPGLEAFARASGVFIPGRFARRGAPRRSADPAPARPRSEPAVHSGKVESSGARGFVAAPCAIGRRRDDWFCAPPGAESRAGRCPNALFPQLDRVPETIVLQGPEAVAIVDPSETTHPGLIPPRAVIGHPAAMSWPHSRPDPF